MAKEQSGLSEFWRRGLRPGSPAAFAFAIACVAIATAIRYAFGLITPEIIAFPTYYPAVLFAALIGGTAAGVLAAALSAISGWYLFFPPGFTFFPISPNRVFSLLLFLGVALIIVAGAEIYRRALRRMDDVARRLQAIADTAVDAIITIDERGIIQSANPATEKLFGHSPKDLIGRNIRELMPPPYRNQHDTFLRNYLETGVAKIIGIGREVTGRRKDDSTFPMHLSVSEFTIDGRRYFTGFVHDLTVQKQAEATTAQLGRLVEDSLDEIYVCDANTLRLVSANRGARNNLGYSLEEIRQRTPLDIKDELSREQYDEIIAPLLSGERERVTFETRHRRKNGSRYPVEVHLQLSRLFEPPVLIAHVRDLTEQKRQQETANLLSRELIHRSNNLLAVVQAVARQTIASSKSLDDFERRFAPRLKAISISQELLARGGHWSGAYLDEVVVAQLAHYTDELGRKIEVSGPRLLLKSEAAQNIGLALHELSVNAGKYGALSVVDGKVTIYWELDPREAEPRWLHMSWIEQGGPRVVPPKQQGFGHIVIDRNLRSTLMGKVQLDFNPEGLSWRVQIPASYIIDQAR